MKSVIFLLIFFTLIANSILGQTASKDLVRADIVIIKNKPTVYLCVDLQQGDSDFVWFQLHNNTIWGLTFSSEQIGKSKAYKLVDGRNVIALEDKAVSTPRYQIENIAVSGDTITLTTDKKPKKIKQTGSNESIVKWGDLATVSWLLSGNYTSFKIPKSYLSERRLICLEYKYQWEIIGTIGFESYAPSHRVYYPFDISDFKSNACTS